MIKAIFFDMFGVIFKNCWADWLKEHQEKLVIFAKSSPPLVVEHNLKAEYPQYYTDLITLNADKKDPNKEAVIDDHTFYSILSIASNQPAEKIQKILHNTDVLIGDLNSNILTFAKALKDQNYKLGLFANCDLETKNRFSAVHKLEKIFDYIIISSEIGEKKPSKEFFNKIVEKSTILPNEILLIDDSPKVTKEANNFGFNTIHFDYSNDNLITLMANVHPFLENLA